MSVMRLDMETRRPPALSVFELFRAFWAEVEAQRAAALSQASPAPPGAEPAAIVHVPTVVRSRLLTFLQAQEADAGAQGKGAGLDYYRQAEYAMVATADEVFVRLPWSGAGYWRANLLETDRFGTRRAGDAMFARIERLIEHRHPAEKELAAVYLTALALGFQGRYADRADGGALDNYRRQLYEVIFEKKPDLTDPFRRLLPQCYDSTAAAGMGRKLRSPRLWWWAVAAVAAIWLVGSHAMWVRISGPLYQQMDQIQEQTRQNDRLQ